ncbi:MAG: SNF2-related protein [Bacilli bacterium]
MVRELSVLYKYVKKANYKVGLTGTPIPNSYTDIYNLLHILFPDEYENFF